MNNIVDQIKARRSVRTFDNRALTAEHREQLSVFMETIDNPWHIPVTFKFLDAKEYGLICPVVVGTDLYVGGRVNTDMR